MDHMLTLETRHEPGCAIVTVAGEIDISTVTALRECLLELAASGHPLVADLDQVTFIDASGLNVLVAAANRAAAHGGGLHVVCARPGIRHLFRVTGLNCRMALARTLDDARETLAATAHESPGRPSAASTASTAQLPSSPAASTAVTNSSSGPARLPSLTWATRPRARIS